MKNKQKWLTKELKGDWIDKDKIFEIVIFESFIHFVEEERGLDQYDSDFGKEIELGFCSQEEADSMKSRKEILSWCYKYVKHDRVEMVNEMNKTMDWRKLEKMDEELYSMDTEIMKTLIENRQYLWT